MRFYLVPWFIIVIVSLALCPAQAQREVGYSEAAVAVPDPTSNCAVGTRTINHDGTAENGYAWSFGGIDPPYYGAFGEAYDLGPGTVSCGAFWFSQVGYFNGMPMDCYVWEGGVTRPPEGVICVVPDVVPTNIPFWPDYGQNDVSIGCDVTGEFTLGFWANFWASAPQWYICADEDGPGGYPWTCIAPDIGYQTGWNHVSVVFPDCKSLLIGAFFNRDPSGIEEFPEDGPPAQSPTWGRIKAIFGA